MTGEVFADVGSHAIAGLLICAAASVLALVVVVTVFIDHWRRNRR